GSVACAARYLASSALRRQVSLSDDIRGGSSNAPNPLRQVRTIYFRSSPKADANSTCWAASQRMPTATHNATASHTVRRRRLSSITRAPCRRLMGVPGQRWQAARNIDGRPVSDGPQRKSPAQRGALATHSLLARRLVAVTAIDIDVGRAHIAAFHWAVPFIRLGRVCGI